MPLVPITILPENAVIITRGTSKTLELVVSDMSGVAVDLTGAKVVMTVKNLITDTNPLIQKSSDNPSQAAITVPRKGTAQIYLVPADTQNLAEKQYVFDVWVIFSSGKRIAVVPPSTFEVKAGVTVLPL